MSSLTEIHPTTYAHSLLGAAFASSIVAVPEPSTYTMMFAGLAALACLRRRRTT